MKQLFTFTSFKKLLKMKRFALTCGLNRWMRSVDDDPTCRTWLAADSEKEPKAWRKQQNELYGRKKAQNSRFMSNRWRTTIDLQVFMIALMQSSTPTPCFKTHSDLNGDADGPKAKGSNPDKTFKIWNKSSFYFKQLNLQTYELFQSVHSGRQNTKQLNLLISSCWVELKLRQF